MNIATRITVTAAEFTRQFGQLRQTLGERPVFITHHGRETHVLLSVARFAALRGERAQPDSSAAVPDRLPQWIREGLIILDANGEVLDANDQAHALLGCAPATLPGGGLQAAVPALAGTVMDALIRRSLSGRERASADLPSPTRPGRWLHLDAYPAHNRLHLLLRDITPEVARDRLADEARAIDQASVVHPGIARFRVNQRGHIVAADPSACAWVGLAEERLRGVALADLMPTARKADFRAALDRVLTDGDERVSTTALLTNQGNSMPVSVALARLSGCYDVEGAIVLATRASDDIGTTGG